MKKLLIAMAIVSLLTLIVWAAAPPNFAGTWALDAAKSEGLPQQMQGDLTWVITQDDKSFKKDVQGGMMAGAENYSLEGKEVAEDVNRGQFSGKAKRMAKVMDKMLELKSVMTANFNGNDITITTTQHLELSEDGKTLQVHQITESPRGSRESKLVFTKK
jgi:hypothetical protein